jgi:hypothetical protein
MSMGVKAAGILSLLLSLPVPRPAEARLSPAITGHRLDDGASHPPGLLSETGLYKDIAAVPRILTDSIHPYQVNAPLWSDGADGERFVSVPYGKKIVPTDSCGYSFPDGTVFVQNLAIDTVAGDEASRILIETRFLVVQTFAAYPYYSGLSYRWRRDQSDADLVDPKSGEDFSVPVGAGGLRKDVRWRSPSQSECNRCHVPESRGSLGFVTQQLNLPLPGKSGTPGLNQLQDLADKGVLDHNPVKDNPNAFRWRALADSDASLEVRARSYLAANCSHCHGNGYNNHAVLSFDYFDSAQVAVYSPGRYYQGYVGLPHEGDTLTPYFIYPGKPDGSFILRRMSSRGPIEEWNADQMPPLATDLADSAAIRLLGEWVRSLGVTDAIGMPKPKRPGRSGTKIGSGELFDLRGKAYPFPGSGGVFLRVPGKEK